MAKPALLPLSLSDLLDGLEGEKKFAAALAASATRGDADWLGLTDSLKALALLAIQRKLKKPLVAVVESEPAADQLVQWLKEWLGEEEARAQKFPALDVFPLAGLPAHPGILSQRGRVLSELVTGALAVAVVPAPALLAPVPNEKLVRLGLLRVGLDGAPPRGELLERLWQFGYTRRERVESVGEYAVHGGVIDLFPPGEVNPLRLDYFGDDLESIHRFALQDQRRMEEADEVRAIRLTPLTEFAVPPEMKEALLDFLRRGDTRAKERLAPLREVGNYPGLTGEARALANFFTAPAALFANRAALTILEAPAVARALERAGASFRESFNQASFAPFAPEQFLDEDGTNAWLDAAVARFGLTAGGETVFEFQSRRPPAFNGDLKKFEAEVRAVTQTARVVLTAKSAGMGERMQQVLHELQLTAHPLSGPLTGAPVLSLALSGATQGFVYPAANLALFTEAEIFGEGRRMRKEARPAAAAFLSDLRDLKPGDLVVHVDHGIARYRGLKTLEETGPDGPHSLEFMILEFSGEGKLFVPVARLDLVQKYVGGDRTRLDALGGKLFETKKSKARAAAKEIAGELLRLYAARRRVKGHAFMPDTEWQSEFESRFPFEETADQAKVIGEVKRDMEAEFPMDRLVLGDVGFGKTEVAMRAAFKAAAEGKQVALLAPTTILAYQHFENFSERFRPFPFKVALMSRFVDKPAQEKTASEIAAGTVTVSIGTHRLLSKDIVYADLGLVIVDEEQRFGVTHKEKLKKLKQGVDSLTLSATPIPRTLQMSLSGLRDLSLIETPPKSRLAIETVLSPFKRSVIEAAIRREVERGGQVFFVHNRIESLPSIAAMLRSWIPTLRVAFAHGQMDEVALEDLLHRFVKGEYDVLCTTTIIENGIDMPNVNTLLVNRADRFGLSQLYQLRGRIGRGDRQAWAILMLPADGRVTPEAAKRLEALREFSDLGAGFRIAALDLELRGAGELLGARQSGHLEAIGFEMYLKMLDDAVRELSGEAPTEQFRTEVNLGLDLTIPESFLGDLNERLILYRRLALAENPQAVEKLGVELKDRYGDLPDKVTRLLTATRLRLRAERLRIESLRAHQGTMAFKFLPASPLDLEKLNAYLRADKSAKFAANGVLSIPAPAPPERLLRAAECVLDALGA